MTGRSKSPGLKQPEISVIIPTWNRAHSLRKAIESALLQSQPVLEVLVCDDGSTDDTFELVAQMARLDHRIRWIPGERGGRPAIPRNRGIQECRGEWVAFLDSDDSWEPDKTAIQIGSAQTLGCLATCSNALRCRPDHEESGVMLDWHRQFLSFSDLLEVNLVVCSSVIVHRSILEQTGGFPDAKEFTVGEDYALWLRVSALTSFSYCTAPLVRYYDDPSNSIRANQELSPATQKRLVLKNLHEWLCSSPASMRGRRGVLGRLWLARQRQTIKDSWSLGKQFIRV